ncbi:type II toxin-antitoxin system HicA family toxin [Planktothrix agardhii]|uniref:type II toxin-antitoxin system HicA family toxin n=1 Tax=Planktothrix agardhii TaxID=1160 RepID=UPI001D0B2384|nr:type II toxin-antitoxin system HicA family toxin [Planktothrix agardhii]MCB8749496.1 type II toxin-antitoxin system HicA family toxin [Planktothrix agardhii 1810]
MSRWKPCKRRDFIQKLHKFGFSGPFSGSKHQFIIYESHRLTIPSNDEYSVPQLRIMIREVEDILARQITLKEWDSL